MVKTETGVWDECLKMIQEVVPPSEFQQWFLPIAAYSLEHDRLTLEVPTPYFYEYIEEHYLDVLSKAISSVLGPDAMLDYYVIVDKGNGITDEPLGMNIQKPLNAPPLKALSQPLVQEHIKGSQFAESTLKPSYTFENYVEGDCNRLARASGIAVGNKPGDNSMNPYFIYGGVGLGKTHLITAIGNQIRAHKASAQVIYLSAESFYRNFVEATKQNKTNEFVAFYKQIDCLIIDDIQFFAGKESTMMVFFDLFNHLHLNNKQIIISSDCPPSELKGMHERLQTRFKWGLTVDLHQPDFETRLAIISRKLSDHGITVSLDVVEYMAKAIETNIREIEGVVWSFVARGSFSRCNLDLNLAREIISRIVTKVETLVDVDDIQETVCDYFNVSVEDLKAKSRRKEIVVPRQIAMFIAREYTKNNLKQIGQAFGGRDHATVIHAVDSVKDLLNQDPSFKRSVEEITKRLQSKSH